LFFFFSLVATTVRTAIIATIAAVIILIAVVAIKILYAQSQQPQAAKTIRETAACLKLDDLQRAVSLIGENFISAIAGAMYLLEHHCTVLDSNTLVKIEKEPSGPDSKYVCIRPRGSDVCLWSPASNIIKIIDAN